MNRIHHIVSADDWDRALLEGSYRHASLATEGFIHFSARDQVEATARKHYVGRTNLVLLTVDPVLLTAELVWEESRGGALFPHLRGSLNVDAVVDVRPFDAEHPGADLP